MFRSLLVVLAVLALLSVVSAQQSSSTARAMSSSSSYQAPASSTGMAQAASSSASMASSSTGPASNSTTGVNPVNPSSNSSTSAFSSSSSSSSGLPLSSYTVLFQVDFAYQITAANIEATAASLQGDIIYNLALLSGMGNSSLIGNVFVTSVNGTAVTVNPTSRRLLQTASNEAGVTYILLGSVANGGLNPTTLINQFANAAATGNLKAVYTNATIPKQQVTFQALSPISSSTGLGHSGASSAASASLALLFAAVAALALLL